jgi:hypothetical protein
LRLDGSGKLPAADDDPAARRTDHLRDRDITTEGERVWFEAQSFAKLKDGHEYQNAYVFFMRIRNLKIIEYKEFADTYYVHRVIDSPQTRGAPKARYRIFDTPSRVFRGNSLGEALRDPASD